MSGDNGVSGGLLERVLSKDVHTLIEAVRTIRARRTELYAILDQTGANRKGFKPEEEVQKARGPE